MCGKSTDSENYFCSLSQICPLTAVLIKETELITQTYLTSDLVSNEEFNTRKRILLFANEFNRTSLASMYFGHSPPCGNTK